MSWDGNYLQDFSGNSPRTAVAYGFNTEGEVEGAFKIPQDSNSVGNNHRFSFDQQIGPWAEISASDSSWAGKYRLQMGNRFHNGKFKTDAYVDKTGSKGRKKCVKAFRDHHNTVFDHVTVGSTDRDEADAVFDFDPPSKWERWMRRVLHRIKEIAGII